jgi:lipoprotein-anchoring transpeptidase ErfK/SrfK
MKRKLKNNSSRGGLVIDFLLIIAFIGLVLCNRSEGLSYLQHVVSEDKNSSETGIELTEYEGVGLVDLDLKDVGNSSYLTPTATAIIAVQNTVVQPSPFIPVSIPQITETPALNQDSAEETTPSLMTTSNEADEKSIVVSISQQQLTAYDGTEPVFTFVVSTGSGNSTLAGSFKILDKNTNAYSSIWNFWMPDWMGIYYAGNLENGFHSLPVLEDGQELWGDRIGEPITYGCIVLLPEDMQQLFDWAEVGTTVNIVR